jgi:hypothetical protein
MTIHINIKIVGKHMLDKFLTRENVKVNGEIARRRHILRTLCFCYNNLLFRPVYGKFKHILLVKKDKMDKTQVTQIYEVFFEFQF